MTNERGYQLCVERLRRDVGFVREKLNEGVEPVELAGRLVIGMDQDEFFQKVAPGLLAVALVLLTTAEVL
jgi:hypothetical protein